MIHFPRIGIEARILEIDIFRSHGNFLGRSTVQFR